MNDELKKIFDDLKKQREEQKHWSEEQWYDYWLTATDRNHWTYFNSIQDIPDVPVVSEKIYNEIIIPALKRCGAIPKDKLVIDATYEGACRNASKAKWDGNEFVYERYKFGDYFDETINHFEDFTEYDIFIPIKKLD